MAETKGEKKTADDEMLQNLKEILKEEVQKHSDFEVVPECIYIRPNDRIFLRKNTNLLKVTKLIKID